jgi:hypothetical protein
MKRWRGRLELDCSTVSQPARVLCAYHRSGVQDRHGIADVRG